MKNRNIRFLLDRTAVEHAQDQVRDLLKEYPNGIPSLIALASGLAFRDGTRLALVSKSFAGDIDGTVQRMSERWSEAFHIELRRLQPVHAV